MHRLGVDIGGTFTDVILVDDERGPIGLSKVPTSHDRPEVAVIDGASTLLAKHGVQGEDIGHFGHGTTLATNTIIEETGVRVGVLITDGFTDVPFLGRARFPDPTNLFGPLPRALITRTDCIGIAERMGADGSVIEPLDDSEVTLAVRRLIESGVEAIVVSFLHAYANPQHEHQARAIVQAEFPATFVCCSSDVWPRPSEFERTVVSVMNAYVGERMRTYLTALDDARQEAGIRAPLLVTRSNGGIMSASSAAAYPVQTMLSGPAGGVVGAAHVARLAGFDKLVGWDMGGTSLDVSIIDGHIRQTDKARVGEYPLFVPTVDVISIGAGGGSIGRVDQGGMLHVGPLSAGSMPGPACYDRGGAEPTLTDAYLTLGILSPGMFAGGTMTLRADLALEALTKFGTKLSMSPYEAAEAMVDVATAQMQGGFMPLIGRYGIEPREFALVAYGGAGATHAFRFTKSSPFGRVIVPRHPGLLCAWGSLIADVRHEVPRAIHAPLEAVDEADLNRILAEMEEEGSAWLDLQAAPMTERYIVRRALVRYIGQSFELDAVLSSGSVTKDAIREQFTEAYHRRYGYSDPEAPLELVEFMVECVGVTTKLSSDAPESRAAEHPRPAPSHRDVYLDGAFQSVPVYRRHGLHAGMKFEGPLIVDQDDTTVFIPQGFRVTVDEQSNIVGELQ